MSDSFYHITKLNESNKKIRVQNSQVYVGQPCLGFFAKEYIYMYSATFDVMKFCLTRVLAKKIGNGYITLETRIVM